MSLRLAAEDESTQAVYEVNFVAGGAPLAAGRLDLLVGNVRDVAHEIADAVVLAAAGEAAGNGPEYLARAVRPGQRDNPG